MTFAEHARIKIPAILKAALGLALFICSESAVYYIFSALHIDCDTYNGAFNFTASVIILVVMILFNKISSKKDEKLFKFNKISPDQTAALVIIGIGMLGMVTTYIIIADRISAYLESLKDAMEQYRENVDRHYETTQVIIPFWDSILYTITLCFIVPLSEEFTFRGVVFGELRRGFGPWITVILSALVFGIMHGVSVHIGYALACGFIIAACYHLTNSLYAPILLHTVFNIFGSGIANILETEQLGVPIDVTRAVLTGLNVSSILFMPVAVLAFAYLVSVNRKKQAKEKELEDAVASKDAADNTTTEPDGNIVLSEGMETEAQE